MKPIVPGILVFFAFCMGSCSDDAAMVRGRRLATPTAYNDYIVQYQQEIIRGFMNLVEKGGGSIDSAEWLRTRLLARVDSSIRNLEALSDYKGDTTMRHAALSLFGFYKRILGAEYREMLQLRRKGEEITQEDVARGEAIAAGINAAERKYDEAFASAQKSFAKKNKLRLQTGPAQKEIDRLNGK